MRRLYLEKELTREDNTLWRDLVQLNSKTGKNLITTVSRGPIIFVVNKTCRVYIYKRHIITK